MNITNRATGYVLQDKKTVRMVAKLWKSDLEFGRQFLNGVHPTRLRRLTALPGNLPLTEDMVKVFLDRGLTLEEEIQVMV